jgi:hypothetical protein
MVIYSQPGAMDALQMATQEPRHRFPSNSLRPLRGPVVARHLVGLSMRTEANRMLLKLVGVFRQPPSYRQGLW